MPAANVFQNHLKNFKKNSAQNFCQQAKKCTKKTNHKNINLKLFSKSDINLQANRLQPKMVGAKFNFQKCLS